MATLYYLIQPSGPTYGKTPSNEYLSLGSVDTHSQKYSSHWDSYGECYFTLQISSVSWERPNDYDTASYELDHGDTDHSPSRAWSIMYISDPDSLTLSPNIPVIGPDYGLSGLGNFSNPERTAYSFQNITFDFDSNVVGSLTYGDFTLSTQDNFFEIGENAFKAAGLGSLATAIGNAGALKTALENIHSSGLSLIESGLRNFDNPNFDAAQFDRDVDAFLNGAQDAATQALIDTTLFPENDALEKVADSILGGARLAVIADRDGAIPLSSAVNLISFEMRMGGVTLEATVDGSVSADLVIDGSESSTIFGNGGNDRLLGGSGDDALIGGGGSDYLHGGTGNDYLASGGEADTMLGGAGNDDYEVYSAGDRVYETTTTTSSVDAGGIDTVFSHLPAYTLGSFLENGYIASFETANLTGNSLGNVIGAGTGDNVLVGGSGVDTLSYVYGTNETAGVSVSLAITTDQATGGSGIDRISGFENLTGSANNDSLNGNSSANVIRGSEGNDSLSGGNGNDALYGDEGADTLLGGAGNDRYYVVDTGDRVFETTTTASATDAGGTDTVFSYLSAYTLGGFVENGRILSAGTASLTGNGLNNVIYSGRGNNFLVGGSGTDTLSYAYGANGTKGVKVSLATAAAQATGGSGTDTISGFERLTGSANNDHLTGNSGANLIRGGNGNDTVIGGAGNDTLHGDAGNDLLRGGTGKDSLDGGAGTDSADYSDKTSAVVVTLNAATAASVSVGGIAEDTIKNIENVTGGSAADKLTGDGLANSLIGNAGNDTLNGKSGADRLLGGSGNDAYYVDNTGDRVYETTTTSSGIDAGGTDTVYSHLSAYTLGSFVENGRILSTGTANMTGNSLNNVIDAGKGNNVLVGGSGTDTLSYAYGANGTTGVKVSLAITAAQATGGSGTDTISGFERLTGSANNDSLTGNSAANLIRGGSANDTVIGGSGNDTLYGDAGNDLLRGGTGNDVLYGGAGKDLFRFDTALGTRTTSNIDQVKDFSVLDDTIQLENAIFIKFGSSTTGTINAAYFKANTTGLAADSNDYIIYETDTGKLFYDSNGSAAGGSVQIALLGTNLALTHADFVLV